MGRRGKDARAPFGRSPILAMRRRDARRVGRKREREDRVGRTGGKSSAAADVSQKPRAPKGRGGGTWCQPRRE
eukprot:5118849-Pyramimonas_sp.AAC.1